MKGAWIYIQFLILLLLVVFLFGFSSWRNAKRELGAVEIEFTNGKDRYITEEMVNNLLIVKRQEGGNTGKDSLDLSVLEQRLNQSSLIAKAEVFRTITGHLGVEITQREPVARVLGATSFYVDTEGEKMPLSPNFSARVPLISGIDSTQLREVFPLLIKIREDEFLKKLVVGIDRQSNGDYIWRLRWDTWDINFGPPTDIDRKIKNFKAFYNRATKDGLLDTYQRLDLKYVNQVVGIKKEN